ncbi:MAG: LON peptidase substrate-binding domain-containing protein [Holosporales bacterium]
MGLTSMLDHAQWPTLLELIDMPGQLLLPRSNLPLNIEDARHKQAILDALKNDRYIGLVQPTEGDGVSQSGCLGRITTFSELEDDRMLVVLKGVIRFRIAETLTTPQGPLRARVDYAPFTFDVLEEETLPEDREQLLSSLKDYLTLHEINANWEEIYAASDDRLIAALAMLCPLDSAEKQALLETPTLQERCRMMTALLEMAFMKGRAGSWTKH